MESGFPESGHRGFNHRSACSEAEACGVVAGFAGADTVYSGNKIMAKQPNNYQPTGFNIAAVLLTAADTTTAKLILVTDADNSTLNQFSIRNADSVSTTVEFLL